ncbi:MAG: hypothetical protein K6C36_06655 [Clostridia bacterium]|nr:hypothetical protein [Clostridia bacterium]
MTKRLFCVVLLLSFIVLSAACGRNEVTVIYTNILSKADTLDPQAQNSAGAKTLILNTYEGLTRVTPEGEVVPAAAFSYEISSDGLTYSFRLRTDGKWYFDSSKEDGLDGLTEANFDARVTSADFVYAFRRGADPATKCSDTQVFSVIKNGQAVLAGSKTPDKLGISAPDDYTLVIQLEKPRTDFLRLLSGPSAMPCSESFFNACGGRYGRRLATCTGNGPFCLTRLRDENDGTRSYRLSKNPVYSGESKPQVDYVWMYQSSDPDNMTNSLAQGDYNMIYADEYRLSVIDAAAYTVATIPNATDCVIFNMNSVYSANASLRKAIASSLDARAVSSELHREHTISAIPGSCLTPGAGFEASLGPEEITELIGKAINELGEQNLTLTLLCPQSAQAAFKKQQQLWQESLTVAVNINIKAVADSSFASELSGGDYDMAFAPVYALSTDSLEYLSQFTPTGKTGSLYGLNISGVNIGVTEALASSGDPTLTERALLASRCVVPICTNESALVYSDKLSGAYVTGAEYEIFFERAHFS